MITKNKEFRRVGQGAPWGYSAIDGRTVPKKKHGHPTTKPEPVMRSLVEHYSDPGMTILDPFMGSGTTGVACVQTGRNFIGIELDEGYCEIARKRIAAAEASLEVPV